MTYPTPSNPLQSADSVRIWALIPCAGTGSRAGTASPKQYQSVAGVPMVQHTLAAFAGVTAITKTLVVVAPDDYFFKTSIVEIATTLIANCGGNTRARSVFNGLNHLLQLGAAAHDWVLVHDAARCLITPAQVNTLIDACLMDAVGGLLAHKLPDTLKSELAGRVAGTIDRSDKWLAQTPQMFRIGPLCAALTQAGDKVTDESSAMEAMGNKPRLVAGSAQNFKVTYPEDFALAEAVIQARQRAEKSRHPLTPATSYDYP